MNTSSKKRCISTIYRRQQLTYYHEGKFKASLDTLPMDLVGKIGKAYIARHVRRCELEKKFNDAVTTELKCTFYQQ